MEENKTPEQQPPSSSLPAVNDIAGSSQHLANLDEQGKQDLIAGLKTHMGKGSITFGDIFNKGMDMAMKDPGKFIDGLFSDPKQMAAELAGEVIIGKAKEIEEQKRELGDGK